MPAFYSFERFNKTKLTAARYLLLKSSTKQNSISYKSLLFMQRSVLIALALILSGCFSTPPIKVKNICDLMDRKVTWYKAVKASEKKYNAPKHVQLAIINQESKFASDAKPPRDKLFGIIPWTRPTSAYGFSQAIDSTWRWYQKDTGNFGTDRNDFADTADFVAWYMNKSKKLSGIAKSDAYDQYLAYHEGHGGFNKKTYQSKSFLLKAAKQVRINAKRYKQQLSRCAKQLDSNSTWSFF